MAQIHIEKAIRVPGDVAAIWAILIESDRFNRALGTAPIAYAPLDEAQPVPTLRGRMQVNLALALDLEIEPYEWIERRRISGRRTFPKGPLRDGKLVFALAAVSPEETEITITLDGERGGGPLGWMASRVAQGMVRDCERVIREIAERARAGADDPFLAAPPPEREAVVAQARALAVGIGGGEGAPEEQRVIDALLRHLGRADEPELRRMRPYELARRWGADPDRTLTILLRAAHAGILDLSWDLLCPNCRRPPGRLSKLSELTPRGHCPACVIGFDIELDRYVEVTFRPAAALLPVDDVVYCMSGPYSTPHIVVQLLLDAGAEQTLELALAPETLRLRAVRTPLSVPVVVSQGGAAEATLRLGDEAGEPAAITLRAGGATLRIHNDGAARRQVILERLGWIDEAATAARVTALAEFRALFPREALAAGEQIRVRRLAFLFSDLKGSTAMYERAGDGPSYGWVRDHFELLGAIIAREGGAVVKTVGDAVMAVFAEPLSATRAALAIQREIPAFNARRGEAEALIVKIGVHAGPCVAVTANDELDYFGTTVNVAARVQGQSAGGDVVVTEQVLAAAGVAELVEGVPGEAFEATLAGLSSPFTLRRLRPT